MTSRARTVIPPLLCAGALAACGGGPRPATRPGGGPAQTVAVTDSPAGNPTLASSATQAAANLAGSWALRAEDRVRRGPLLELAIDSVTGWTFRVRVAFLMSGNVGIDPTRFETTSGTVSPDGLVRFTVTMRDQTEPVGQLSGTLEQDTIRLHTFRWAGEDQTAGGVRWLLVKQPS